MNAIKLRRRNLIQRFLVAPKVFLQHYRILRKKSGRLESLKAAMLLIPVLIYDPQS